MGAALIGAAALAAGVCQPATAASPPASTASITVNLADVGAAMPAGFVGLSIGASSLAAGGSAFKTPDLATYLKTLDPAGGVLRVGGNSADETFWTSTGQTPPSWSVGTITPASLAALASVAKASGWKVILGVNFKHLDPAGAADEASYAEKILGSSLQYIEIGNEPNYYYTSTSAYFANFESYVAAIRKAVPGIGIEGPDPGHDHPAFLAAFVSNEAKHPDINELSNHHYPLSNCSTPAPTIAELLSTASVQSEVAAADAVVSGATELHVPAAITETNSVTCAGTAGVSNVYASSLWALDEGMILASNGVSSADFSGGVSGCGTYWPACTSGSGFTGEPVLYGILAIGLVGTGHFVSVSDPDYANIRAYAIENGPQLTVVLDDVQNPAGNGPTTVTLSLSTAFSEGSQTLLSTSSSAGLSAQTGITLGGQTLAGNGTFPAPRWTPVTVAGHSVTVTLKAATATIIQLS
jgi:hypothetical protein